MNFLIVTELEGSSASPQNSIIRSYSETVPCGSHPHKLLL